MELNLKKIIENYCQYYIKYNLLNAQSQVPFPYHIVELFGGAYEATFHGAPILGMVCLLQMFLN